MDASILVCTYNRATVLDRALASLVRLDRRPDVTFEVVAVDNNSTDRTSDVLADYADRLPLVCHRETRPGKSHALNSGLDRCRGEFILLTDDDVVVCPDWVCVTVDAFRRWACDAVFGRILPLWPAPVPRWYSKRLDPALALLDYGDTAFQMQPGDSGFFGANAAIRRKAIEAVGRWSTALNRVGTGLAMGEDSAICQRLAEQRFRVRYEPRSVVYHDVGLKRMNKTYFRSWFRAHGRSSVIRQSEWPCNGSRLAGVPAYLFRMAGEMAWQALCRRWRGTPAEAFAIEMGLQRVLGAVCEFHQRRREG